jgi:hypothetical protein
VSEYQSNGRRQTDDGRFPARREPHLAEVALQLSRQKLSLAADRLCVGHGWNYGAFPGLRLSSVAGGR